MHHFNVQHSLTLRDVCIYGFIIAKSNVYNFIWTFLRPSFILNDERITYVYSNIHGGTQSCHLRVTSTFIWIRPLDGN